MAMIYVPAGVYQAKDTNYISHIVEFGSTDEVNLKAMVKSS